MSDGTLIIDTALDADGLEKDLGKLDKNVQKGVTSMAETIGSSVAEGLIDNMLKTLGDGVLEALEESLTPEEAEAFGEKLGDMAAQAYMDAWSQGDFNALGESIIKDVESGAKERALAAGEAVGEDVAEGFQSEVNEDTGEKAGKKVQDGLEDKLDKDDGKKLGKEAGKGIGDGIQEGAKPGIASTGELIKGILTADAIKSLAKSAFGAIKDFATEGIQLASDLAESQNVVDVTFGESAGAVNEWARNAKSGYGMSELAAKKFNGTMGAMFKSMGKTEKEAAGMSMTMVGLAGDMASFYNLEHDEAFNKIRSGISGETEPLKQLGINMSVANLEAYALSQGIKKSYDSMTQAEQATLRYNYLLSATADAQGDFVRNGDSYANQMKVWDTNLNELKTTIGTALLPVLTSAVSWLNNLFDGTGKKGLSEEVKNATEGLNSIKTDITNIKNNYANTTLKIQINYQASQELTDELAKLQETPDIDLAGTERIKEITDSLVALYPELSKYVGSDGIIHKEAAEVKTLIDGYAALNKQQAYAKMVQDLQELHAQRMLDLELAKGTREEYYNELVAINARTKALEEADKLLNIADVPKTALAGGAYDNITGRITNQIAAVESLRSATNSFMDLDWSKFSEIDMSFGGLLFDEQGAMRSIDYFQNNAEAARQLYEFIHLSNQQVNGLIGTTSEAAATISANYEASAESVNTATGELESLEVQLEAGKKILDENTASIEANNDATEKTADAIGNAAKSITYTEDQLRLLTLAMGGNAEGFEKLSEAGISYDDAIAAIGRGAKTLDEILKEASDHSAGYLKEAVALTTVEQTKLAKSLNTTFHDIERVKKAGVSYKDAMTAVKAGAKSVDEVLLATAGNAAANIDDVKKKTKTIKEYAEEIKTANTEATAAQTALAEAKKKVATDSEAMVTAMTTHTETLTTAVKTMTETMNQTITDAAVGAATAGRDMAKATGDGYKEKPYLKDAVTAALSDTLFTLAATVEMFKNAGRNLISAVAQGVKENSGVLSSAMRDAVQSAVVAAQSASVASYGSRFGYPHRAGLEYVPYDEYPATLHKGEAVLTATEAALWRGGMYVQEPQARGAQLDYDAMARAIWANAPEGGDTIMVMSDEIVGRLTEPTVSTLQGRRAGR